MPGPRRKRTPTRRRKNNKIVELSCLIAFAVSYMMFASSSISWNSTLLGSIEETSTPKVPVSSGIRSEKSAENLQQLIKERQANRQEEKLKAMEKDEKDRVLNEELGDHIDYTKPAVRNNSTLPDPKLFTNETTITIVLSARANFDKRKMIRETWGQNHSVYFAIGGPSVDEEKTIQESLVQEQEKHEDIIDSIHEESYRSLPYKLRFSYKFVLDHLPQAKWVLKVDDDMVARIDTLTDVLLTNLNHEYPLVIGRIIKDAPVHKDGKWADLKYKKDVYPPWPQGSCGHVLSRPVVEHIVHMKDIVYYQGEDVSIGIWLDESPDFPVRFIRSLYFQNHGRCDEKEWLVIGHKVTPEQMLSCYKKQDEWHSHEVHKRHIIIMQTEDQRKNLPDACFSSGSKFLGFNMC